VNLFAEAFEPEQSRRSARAYKSIRPCAESFLNLLGLCDWLRQIEIGLADKIPRFPESVVQNHPFFLLCLPGRYSTPQSLQTNVCRCP